MATLYLKTAGGNWTAAGTWSNVSAAGGDSSGPPTAADDCIAELLSGNVTIDSGAVCRSFDCTGGTGSYTGTATHTAAVTLTVGDATAGAGNVALRLSAGMTYTLGSTTSSAITFVSSSTTTQTLTSAGKTLGNLTFNHVNLKIQLSGSLTSSGNTFTVTAMNTFDMNGNQFTLSGTNATFTGGGLTYSSQVNLTSNGAAIIAGTNTFSGGLSRTGTAITGCTLIFNANQTISGGNFTVTGNSVINRVIIRSNTVGTARTITNAGSTASWSNVDCRDITLGTSYDASGITGNSGDCGGNTNITFTTPATQTATGTASFTWSTHGWTSRVPLPQDDVVINNAFVAGRTVTCDMPRLGKNIDLTGLSGSPTFSGFTSGVEIYGSLTLVSGITWTPGTTISFNTRTSSTLTSAGKSFAGVTFNCASGTITLQDALISSAVITATMGTFNSNGFSVTSSSFSGQAAGTITLGASTWTITGTGAVWTCSSTLNAGTSTISITDTSASSKTFASGSRTYFNLQWTAGGSGAIILTASPTFNSFVQSGVGTKTITLPVNQTITFTDAASALPSGTAGNLITYQSSSAGTAYIISCVTAQLSCDYISLQDCTGAGNVPHFAGANSTNVSGNTNWSFTAPVVGVVRGNFLLLGVG